MMLIKIRNNTFRINPGQNNAMWEYINTGKWEPHSFTILDYFVPENGIVIDLGSWSGVLSLYIASKAKKIYAIDPDFICFQELTTNIALNPDLSKKIESYNLAISDRKGMTRLSARNSYGQSSSSILQRKRDTEYSKEVKTLSLLNFLEQENIQQLDFIKMDIEGAEFYVLPEIGKAIKLTNYPTLYISFHYNFLNEHIYHQYVNSKFLNRALMKFEKLIRFSIFKTKIKLRIMNLFDDLQNYKYIYTVKGELVSTDFLKHHFDFIKNNDLVFTNKKWS